MVAAEPLGAFNRDPNDLVLTVGGKLVVNHLLEMRFAISKPKFGLCWYGCECFLLCLSL